MKNKKRIPQRNEKTSGNQALQKKFNQMDKHLGRPPRLILRTILKIDKRRTQTKRWEDKKIDDDGQGLTSERWYRQTICVKKRRSIEDSMEASIQELTDYVKKWKWRLITAASTDNVRTNKK